MKEIYINIQDNIDRVNIINGLVKSGYTVRLEVKTVNIRDKEYWIIFKVPNLNINDGE